MVASPPHPRPPTETEGHSSLSGGAEAQPSQMTMPSVLRKSFWSPRHFPAAWRSPHPSLGPQRLLSLEPIELSKTGAFIVTQFPGHKDCTAGAQCCGASPDSPSFTPLTWQPKPIFAFWQQGCSSRPAPPRGCPGVDRAGRRDRIAVRRKAPRLCICPNYCPAAKAGGWVSLRPPQVPFGFTCLACHQEDQLILGHPGLSRFTLIICIFWTPCSFQGNCNGWSPYMSPRGRLRPAGVSVSLPLCPCPIHRSLKDPQPGCIHPTNISVGCWVGEFTSLVSGLPDSTPHPPPSK